MTRKTLFRYLVATGLLYRGHVTAWRWLLPKRAKRTLNPMYWDMRESLMREMSRLFSVRGFKIGDPIIVRRSARFIRFA